MVKKRHNLLDGASTLGAPGPLSDSFLPPGMAHGLPDMPSAAEQPRPTRKQDGKSAGIVAKKSQSFRHQGR
jgi:hypothetical protein